MSSLATSLIPAMCSRFPSRFSPPCTLIANRELTQLLQPFDAPPPELLPVRSKLADDFQSRWPLPFPSNEFRGQHGKALGLTVQELDVQARLLIAARLRSKYVEAGHDLCRQGEPATCLWLLEEGGSS